MKSTHRFAAAAPLVLSVCIQAAAEPPAAQTPSATGRTDRPPLSYAPGDPAVFEFSVTGPAPGSETFVKWTFRADGIAEAKSGVERIPAGRSSFAITNTLRRPGFATASVAVATGPDGRLFRVAGRTVSSTVSAGFGIGEIRTIPEPGDFDDFWAGVKAEADAADLSRAVTFPAPEDVPAQLRDCTVFGFRVPIPGRAPATGWVAFPRNAAETSLPAEIRFRDYGMGGGVVSPALGGDALCADVNAHGFELAREPAYYRAFMDAISDGGHGGGYAFRDAENDSPHTCYLRGMALRALVAARYLRSLPQWDGASFTVSGEGQGAYLATAVAALDGSVSALKVSMPWPCDIGGAELAGRMEGWLPEYRPALRYFDAANLAARISAPCEIDSIGLADFSARPSGAAAYFNALRGRKSALWVQGRGHETGPVPEGVQTQNLLRP